MWLIGIVVDSWAKGSEFDPGSRLLLGERVRGISALSLTLAVKMVYRYQYSLWRLFTEQANKIRENGFDPVNLACFACDIRCLKCLRLS